jgi:type I restriction enzyme R subunit
MVDDYLMNIFTIDTVLMNILKVGIKEAKSETVGKTIIFAQNRKHGELILQRFRIKFPDFGNEFIKLALFNDRDSVNDFIDPNKNMNILIDVGFATMGMNIPEILNIVLFKKVYSKFEFQQMISIGNRICNNITCIEPKEGIYIGKKRYYVFDYLENFTFFNEDKKAINGVEVKNIAEEIFIKYVRLIYSIQNDKTINKEYHAFATKLIDYVVTNIENVSKELTNVHLQLKNIDRYCIKSTYTDGIMKEDKIVLETQIAPLVRMRGEEYSLQFDNFMYGLMLSQVEATPFFIRAKEQLGNICNMLLKNENEPEVKNEKDFIQHYGSSKFLDNSTIIDLEQVRLRLRKIIQYLFSSGSNKEEDEKKKRTENFKEKNNRPENIPEKNVNVKVNADANTSTNTDAPGNNEEDEAENNNKTIKAYKDRIIEYIMNSFHQVAVYKLRNNIPIDDLNYRDLNKTFVKRLGTKKNYEDAFGDLPYGLLVREVAKLDKESVKVAFFDVTNDKTLNDSQKHFLNVLMKDVMENGYLEDDEVTGNENEKYIRFRELFDDGRQKKIIKILNSIKANAIYK